MHAQEYQLSEIEEIAESFFNKNPQYAPDVNRMYYCTTKQIASIEPIFRDSINYMYVVNTRETGRKRYYFV